MADLSKIMEQAQEMQKQMQTTQDKLASMQVTGQAPGGVVKVTMNGRHQVLKVYIDPSLLDPDLSDPAMTEDLVVAAVNDAVQAVETLCQGEIKRLTAGFDFPKGLMDDKDKE